MELRKSIWAKRLKLRDKYTLKHTKNAKREMLKRKNATDVKK